jgi:hypothetical protein
MAALVRALHYSDDGAGDLLIDDGALILEVDIDSLDTGYVTRGRMAAFLRRALG